MLPTLDSSTEMSMLQDTGSRSSELMTSNVWEENFQDLSSFCQDPKLSNLTSDMSTGRENSSVLPDDELNTPEIGYEEFNFNSWPKPESLDDNYLWDEDPLVKIGSDRYGGESMFSDAQNWEDLPDEKSIGCVSIDYAPEETVLPDKPSYNSDVDVSNDAEKNEHKNQGSVQESYVIPNLEQSTTLELYSSDITEVSNNSLNENAALIKEETVSQVASQPRSNLSLPLTTFENADVLKTPDVLNSPQLGFDLVSFVLEDNLGTCNTNADSSSPPIPNSCVISVPVKEEVVETVMEEEISVSVDSNPVDNESFDQCISENETPLLDKKDLSSESQLVVHPSSHGSSKVCIIIKRDFNAEAKLIRKSRKRSLSVSQDELSEKSDSQSSDEEYIPPVKLKKQKSSCRKTAKAECSRYRELRNRNNEASRKSRLNRKVKEEEMKVQAAQLEVENQKLRIRAEELEKLVDTLRKALLTAMVKGKD